MPDYNEQELVELARAVNWDVDRMRSFVERSAQRGNDFERTKRVVLERNRNRAGRDRSTSQSTRLNSGNSTNSDGTGGTETTGTGNLQNQSIQNPEGLTKNVQTVEIEGNLDDVPNPELEPLQMSETQPEPEITAEPEQSLNQQTNFTSEQDINTQTQRGTVRFGPRTENAQVPESQMQQEPAAQNINEQTDARPLSEQLDEITNTESTLEQPSIDEVQQAGRDSSIQNEPSAESGSAQQPNIDIQQTLEQDISQQDISQTAPQEPVNPEQATQIEQTPETQNIEEISNEQPMQDTTVDAKADSNNNASDTPADSTVQQEDALQTERSTNRTEESAAKQEAQTAESSVERPEIQDEPRTEIEREPQADTSSSADSEQALNDRADPDSTMERNRQSGNSDPAIKGQERDITQNERIIRNEENLTKVNPEKRPPLMGKKNKETEKQNKGREKDVTKDERASNPDKQNPSPNNGAGSTAKEQKSREELEKDKENPRTQTKDTVRDSAKETQAQKPRSIQEIAKDRNSPSKQGVLSKTIDKTHYSLQGTAGAGKSLVGMVGDAAVSLVDSNGIEGKTAKIAVKAFFKGIEGMMQVGRTVENSAHGAASNLAKERDYKKQMMGTKYKDQRNFYANENVRGAGDTKGFYLRDKKGTKALFRNLKRSGVNFCTVKAPKAVDGLIEKHNTLVDMGLNSESVLKGEWTAKQLPDQLGKVQSIINNWMGKDKNNKDWQKYANENLPENEAKAARLFGKTDKEGNFNMNIDLTENQLFCLNGFSKRADDGVHLMKNADAQYLEVPSGRLEQVKTTFRNWEMTQERKFQRERVMKEMKINLKDRIHSARQTAQGVLERGAGAISKTVGRVAKDAGDAR